MNLHNILAWLTLFSHSIYADTITVNNHARYPVYAAIYYVRTNLLGQSIGPATRQEKPIAIPSCENAAFDRPQHLIMLNREIIFSTKSADLEAALDVDVYKKAAIHRVGTTYGSTFHIAEKDNVLHCYTAAEYNIEKPILEEADKLIDAMLNKLQKSYSNHAYAKTTAKVRTNNTLCQEEIESTANRIAKVNNTLTNLLSMNIPQEKTPRIALCLSGGGMRAATCSYGLVAGLSDIGLLDAVTYCVALSGSTWFLTDWIFFGQPIDEYHNHFCKALSHMRPVALDALSTVLWPKYIFKQDTSIVDLYGAYLANTFFRQIKDSEARQKATLSSLRDSIKDGSWPLPICTAVETSVDNHWVTFTPFEVGSDTLHFHIPTWAFGRKFSGGISTDYAPEQSLGYFMGIWGSALSGSIEDILGTLAGLNPILMHTIKDALVTIGASDLRWAAIKIHNPLYGSPDSPHRKRNISELIFMDGGYAYNIPITPIVKKERAVDIIIIMDASQGVHNGNQDFKKAIADISNQGIALPPIDFSTDIHSSISIFADPTNPKVPTIIYVMPSKEDGYDTSFDPAKEFSTTYKTADFSCKESDIDKLTGLIRYSIASKKDTIIGTIKDVIAKK